MTIEEKAKAYDEALKKAKDMLAYKEVRQEDIEYLFPELKESEDEKIRKQITGFITYSRVLDETKKIWLAWLEKQGAHAEFLDKIQIGDKVTRNEDGVLVNLSQLKRVAKRDEKQGEQKPADKVEPKFKIEKGKCYVCIRDLDDNYGTRAFHKGSTYYSTKDETLLPDNSNVPFEIKYCVNDYFRLWTIKDSKDGDVLKEDSCIFIIEKMNPNGTAIVHCCLFDDGDFDLIGSTLSFDVDSTYPATKEQRDLLFQKMKETGYEWDAEKKELKKIEQKPTDRVKLKFKTN